MCGGFFTIIARSDALVSPVRTWTRTGAARCRPASPLAQPLERLNQILLNVVAERLERRHVEHRGLVGERAVGGAAKELIQAAQERGQRLARAGRSGDQHAAAFANRGPAANLRLGRLADLFLKPGAHHRVKRSQRFVHRHRTEKIERCLGRAIARRPEQKRRL